MHDDHLAWAEVLDQLERDAEMMERLAGSDAPEAGFQPAPWEPPAIRGPLPDELLDRAREVQRRQDAARAALTEALAAVRDRQRLSRRPAALPVTPARPAYVDISA